MTYYCSKCWRKPCECRTKSLRDRWADASRYGRHDEAGRLLQQLIQQHLKPPPELDMRYWADLLRRRMKVLARKEHRLNDEEFDRIYGDANQ